MWEYLAGHQRTRSIKSNLNPLGAETTEGMRHGGRMALYGVRPIEKPHIRDSRCSTSVT